MKEIKSTTIKIDRDTKNRLDKLKIHRRETYDDIIQKMLGILNLCRVDPSEARMKLQEIDRLKKHSK